MSTHRDWQSCGGGGIPSKLRGADKLAKGIRVRHHQLSSSWNGRPSGFHISSGEVELEPPPSPRPWHLSDDHEQAPAPRMAVLWALLEAPAPGILTKPLPPVRAGDTCGDRVTASASHTNGNTLHTLH